MLLAVAGALGAVAALVALVVVRPLATDGRPRAAPDAAVVLDERAPRPSATPTPTTPATPPPFVDRVDVVCSNLQRRTVAVSELDDAEPGSVVQVAGGPCVVMGREGAAVP